MKIISSFLSFSSAANYHGHRFLSGEKLIKRSDNCREKVDEATSIWSVENGEWECPLYDSNHFKITCYPKCPDDSWKKNWKHSPYKKRPKIITTCGDPATYKLKHMEESTTFTCTQKPHHPCDVQVENINIENGEIEKIKIQNAVKAAYSIVCTGPQKQGQKTKITCTGSEPENTYWTAPKGPNNWRSVCEEEDLPEIDPDFSSLTGQITPNLLTCTQEENKIFAADSRLQFGQEAKIVGGVEAADNAWPWIVRLEFSDGEGGTSTCGGSVIANRWVLSAAHCCEGASGIRGFFGDLKIDETDSSEYELQAINWVVHWEFGNNSDGSASNSDLCLIKFEEDILEADPEGKVGIACLPNKREEHGAACWVAGWGTTEYGGDGSNELLSVGVNILDHEYWDGIENSKFTSIGINSLLPDDICASKPDLDGDGFIDAGSDACQGDSGGPLICPVDGKATIVGVVSRGYGCAWKGYPGIYTSAFQLRFWIRKFIERYGA